MFGTSTVHGMLEHYQDHVDESKKGLYMARERYFHTDEEYNKWLEVQLERSGTTLRVRNSLKDRMNTKTTRWFWCHRPSTVPTEQSPEKKKKRIKKRKLGSKKPQHNHCTCFVRTSHFHRGGITVSYCFGHAGHEVDKEWRPDVDDVLDENAKEVCVFCDFVYDTFSPINCRVSPEYVDILILCFLHFDWITEEGAPALREKLLDEQRMCHTHITRLALLLSAGGRKLSKHKVDNTTLTQNPCKALRDEMKMVSKFEDRQKDCIPNWEHGLSESLEKYAETLKIEMPSKQSFISFVWHAAVEICRCKGVPWRVLANHLDNIVIQVPEREQSQSRPCSSSSLSNEMKPEEDGLRFEKTEKDENEDSCPSRHDNLPSGAGDVASSSSAVSTQFVFTEDKPDPELNIKLRTESIEMEGTSAVTAYKNVFSNGIDCFENLPSTSLTPNVCIDEKMEVEQLNNPPHTQIVTSSAQRQAVTKTASGEVGDCDKIGEDVEMNGVEMGLTANQLIPTEQVKEEELPASQSGQTDSATVCKRTPEKVAIPSVHPSSSTSAVGDVPVYILRQINLAGATDSSKPRCVRILKRAMLPANYVFKKWSPLENGHDYLYCWSKEDGTRGNEEPLDCHELHPNWSCWDVRRDLPALVVCPVAACSRLFLKETLFGHLKVDHCSVPRADDKSPLSSKVACRECNLAFLNWKSLDLHIRTAHTLDGRLEEWQRAHRGKPVPHAPYVPPIITPALEQKLIDAFSITPPIESEQDPNALDTADQELCAICQTWVPDLCEHAQLVHKCRAVPKRSKNVYWVHGPTAKARERMIKEEERITKKRLIAERKAIVEAKRAARREKLKSEGRELSCPGCQRVYYLSYQLRRHVNTCAGAKGVKIEVPVPVLRSPPDVDELKKEMTPGGPIASSSFSVACPVTGCDLCYNTNLDMAYHCGEVHAGLGSEVAAQDYSISYHSFESTEHFEDWLGGRRSQFGKAKNYPSKGRRRYRCARVGPWPKRKPREHPSDGLKACSAFIAFQAYSDGTCGVICCFGHICRVLTPEAIEHTLREGPDEQMEFDQPEDSNSHEDSEDERGFKEEDAENKSEHSDGERVFEEEGEEMQTDGLNEIRNSGESFAMEIDPAAWD